VNIDAELPAGVDTLSKTFDNARADAVLDVLAKATDTATRVTADNELQIAPPEQLGNPVPIRLENIIDIAAGSRRPPFQSVQVVGNTATIEQGLNADHLIASQPVLAEAGSGQPTFLFEDDSINSQAEANNIANALLRRLQKQQQGGFALIVGRPDIRPFDRVTLPDAQGGGTFLVDSLEHSLSGTDGFRTRLSLSGTLEL
jgi:hypothetical protein